VLARQALQAFDLPLPRYLVCDVGSCIYVQQQGQYLLQHDWQDYIAADWRGYEANYLAELLLPFDSLQVQEPALSR
jgi:hypothetical protein